MKKVMVEIQVIRLDLEVQFGQVQILMVHQNPTDFDGI
jgi:hypothetical protein